MNYVQRLETVHRMRPAAGIALAVVACAAIAASDDEHREHAAHEHGHGTLDIVLEGEELLIELRIPAVNVVGFEHAPGDDSEREAVREALVPFGDAASVFVLPAKAECEVEEVEARIHGMAHEDEHEDEHEGEHEGEGHEDDERRHGSDGHEEHEDDEHGSETGTEAHSELLATYRFHCHEPEALDRIDVHAFEHLRDAEEIDVRVVTPVAQRAMELHPDSTVIELSP